METLLHKRVLQLRLSEKYNLTNANCEQYKLQYQNNVFNKKKYKPNVIITKNKQK